ncbi:hypothetical protein [Paenibacillus alginolyticus]|nr:hypothetical protein [Paenibacillus alginolyticus]MEC0143426.1 hypothetical protein [Paenibacillus alginolyticus]
MMRCRAGVRGRARVEQGREKERVQGREQEQEQGREQEQERGREQEQEQEQEHLSGDQMVLLEKIQWKCLKKCKITDFNGFFPMKSVILGCLGRFHWILSNGDWGGFMLISSSS